MFSHAVSAGKYPIKYGDRVLVISNYRVRFSPSAPLAIILGVKTGRDKKPWKTQIILPVHVQMILLTILGAPSVGKISMHNKNFVYIVILVALVLLHLQFATRYLFIFIYF